MRKLTTLFAVMALTTSSMAGMTCHKDFLGNLICNYDDGYQTTTHRDFLGNDVIRDNRGGSMSCYTDFLGNYKCN